MTTQADTFRDLCTTFVGFSNDRNWRDAAQALHELHALRVDPKVLMRVLRRMGIGRMLKLLKHNESVPEEVRDLCETLRRTWKGQFKIRPTHSSDGRSAAEPAHTDAEPRPPERQRCDHSIDVSEEEKIDVDDALSATSWVFRLLTRQFGPSKAACRYQPELPEAILSRTFTRVPNPKQLASLQVYKYYSKSKSLPPDQQTLWAGYSTVTDNIMQWMSNFAKVQGGLKLGHLRWCSVEAFFHWVKTVFFSSEHQDGNRNRHANKFLMRDSVDPKPGKVLKGLTSKTGFDKAGLSLRVEAWDAVSVSVMYFALCLRVQAQPAFGRMLRKVHEQGIYLMHHGGRGTNVWAAKFVLGEDGHLRVEGKNRSGHLLMYIGRLLHEERFRSHR